MKKLLLCMVTVILFCTTAWAGEKVSFPHETASGGVQAITAELVKPPGPGPFPAVVYLHGCAGIRPGARQLTDRLTDWGYAVLLVDSLGPRGVASVCGRPLRVGPRMRAADANAARAYLARRPDIDGKRIAVLGMSHGGWAVMHLVQPEHAPQGKERFRAAVAFYPFCDQPLDHATAPLLILIGDLDEFCPARRCVDRTPLGQTAHEVVVKVYPGVHHAFDIKGLDRRLLGKRLLYDPKAAADAVERVKGFLARHMK